MARKGRKKKQTITYDSKETSTFLGLVLMIFGLFFGISVFTVTEGETTLFSQAKDIFGNATIFLSIYLILIGVKFLGGSLKFIRTVNLISQAILIILIAGLFTAFDGSDKIAVNGNGANTNGGHVGFWILRNIFGDLTPALASTKIILVAVTLVIIPPALTLSLNKTVEIIKKVLSTIKKIFVDLFIGEDFDEENAEKNIFTDNAQSSDVQTQKAARFGDFNKLIARKDEPVKNDTKKEKTESVEQNISVQKPEKKDDENSDNYKDAELGEDGLKQETLQYPGWKLPPLSLLFPFKASKPKESQTKEKADIIEQILASFNIEAKVEDAYIGPSVIQYALNIPLGIKVSKVATLSENIALALGVDSKAVRVETIPGTTYLGIEVPRSNRDMVQVKELMSSNDMQNTKRHLPVPVGKDIHGNTIVAGIEKMPHLLIAGATGSGKSILTNSFITSLIMNKTPDELKLLLVDPKQVELMDYNGIPHLLTPVITDMDKVVNALKWAVTEMDKRYSHLASETVRNIEQYNEKKGFAAMPYIVIVIDEMADMMMTANKVESENAIVRIAQKARAVGIHLILATQRPSVNVITGIIKANIPGRIGMSVTSSTDSRVILDSIGAESLMGAGDLLYKAPDQTKSSRLQSSYIDQQEVIRVVDFIKAQAPEVEYITEITERQLSPEDETNEALGDISEDNLVEQAIRAVVKAQKGSSSYLQRRLSIGFNRAARLLEELEEAGVVGPPNGSKPREVLITDADSFIQQLKSQGEI